MMSQINIKFLVDVNIGRSVEEWLLANGYDMKAVRDINPRMLDRDILKMAVSENRVVITMDRDFGELVYNSGMPHSGVLLLRLEDATANEKVEILEKILISYPDKLLNNFCVFQHGKIRIRK